MIKKRFVSERIGNKGPLSLTSLPNIDSHLTPYSPEDYPYKVLVGWPRDDLPSYSMEKRDERPQHQIASVLLQSKFFLFSPMIRRKR